MPQRNDHCHQQEDRPIFILGGDEIVGERTRRTGDVVLNFPLQDHYSDHPLIANDPRGAAGEAINMNTWPHNLEAG